MQQLTVELADRSYPIYIGSGLLGQPDLLTAHLSGRQVFVVTDDTVAPLYLTRLFEALDGYQAEHVILPTGEAYKTWNTLQQVFDGLLAARHDRGTTLIALGGGVIGDMTGFAAACYQRGVNFIQIPTTLLSQVDSSVGGKTGINHPAGKNMIGAFYQPQAVIIDTDTLHTLPEREISAGLAEIIKYGLIRDREFLDWLETNMPALRALEPAVITQAIARSCAIKAEIVAVDEREGGLRAILNLGHTFGHAIEAHQGYGRWLHGEAVGAGMVMALELSKRSGWLTQEEQDHAVAIIRSAGLPVAPPRDMTADDFMRLMAVDKKVVAGRLRLVLLSQIGEATVTADFDVAALRATLHTEYLTEHL